MLCWQMFLWWIVIVLFLIVISLLLSVESTSYKSTHKLLARNFNYEENYMDSELLHDTYSAHTILYMMIEGRHWRGSVPYAGLKAASDICSNSKPSMNNFQDFCHYSFAIHYSCCHL